MDSGQGDRAARATARVARTLHGATRATAKVAPTIHVSRVIEAIEHGYKRLLRCPGI